LPPSKDNAVNKCPLALPKGLEMISKGLSSPDRHASG
jgi:hypothetical protein